MSKPVFIRLENTLEATRSYRNSPRMQRYSFAGVQLLPRYLTDATGVPDNPLEINPYPYIQVSEATDGIELEDFTVWLCDMCGDRLADITEYFTVTPFQDLNGIPQVEWQLLNVEYDAGYRMVYMEIEQGANSTVYSSPFMLTADRMEYTSRWDYRNKLSETMLSVGLQLWFKQEDDMEEVTTYDTVSTGRRVTITSKLIPYEVWQTSVIDYRLFRLIKQMRRNTYVYCDLVKTSPFEAMESPRLEERENFAEQEITLCRDESQVYDPFYVPPIPPDPPVDVPFINLIRVDSQDLKKVLYTFEYGFFDPSYLTYQYSLDGITWFDSTNGAVSPQQVGVANHTILNYYYRIYYLALDLYSNIVQLTQPSIVITNITSPQTSFNNIGNTYNIYYTVNGFTPESDFAFEASFDGGSTWVGQNYSSGYQNPKFVSTISSPTEWNLFRIKYGPLGLYSNEFEFEF